MKTLYIVRHAKSSWKHKSFSDFERPLRKKGVEDLRAMIDVLKARNVRPDLLMTSPAIRAIQTAVLVTQGLDMPSDSMRMKNELYLGTCEQYLDCVKTLSQECQSAMIVGHHPGVTDTINSLLGEELHRAATSSVHAIQWDEATSWKKCLNNPGQLVFAMKPKNL